MTWLLCWKQKTAEGAGEGFLREWKDLKKRVHSYLRVMCLFLLGIKRWALHMPTKLSIPRGPAFILNMAFKVDKKHVFPQHLL